MNDSVEVNQDYVMVMYNPVEDSFAYKVYHVLDFSKINGKTHVNIQVKDKNKNLKRISLSEHKFYDLIYKRILTRFRK
ncbi:MAG: hypothetical protein CBC02_009110 [Flavobacteriaceae bacterium TMED42]|nr:MAG: hypothetical protein CBC02_009110 [Flavobacteriaceae bacterium TMED42]|tara:strand:- start:1189 stop:1422 length:234 start_codon:yes stop_codon:yes gene_type:complete